MTLGHAMHVLLPLVLVGYGLVGLSCGAALLSLGRMTLGLSESGRAPAGSVAAASACVVGLLAGVLLIAAGTGIAI